MTSVVSGQFIRSTECPITPVPGTVEGFLTRVHSTMSLEMRALGVHLGTSRMVTAIHLLELSIRVSRSHLNPMKQNQSNTLIWEIYGLENQ